MKNQSLSDRLPQLSPEETRPLTEEEIALALDELSHLRRSREYAQTAKAFLLAFNEGGDIWRWGITPDDFLKRGGVRPGYSYGWWVVRGNDIVASLCYAYS